VLPKSDGLKSPLLCLSQARYGISWGAIGAAMACYDTALQYAKQRKQFRNEPIAGHQLVQEKLTWMITEISKAQLLALQVGRLKDKGKAGFQHISMAKRNNVWMALECARLARDILGGVEYSRHPEGYHFWLPLPAGTSPSYLVDTLRPIGLSVVPSDVFAVEPKQAAPALRVSIGGSISRERLARALRMLDALLAHGSRFRKSGIV